MHPEFWGPHGWIFLHSITFEYPSQPTDQDKKKYYDFFHNLHYVLPCVSCAQHYQEHLIKYPLTEEVLQNKKTLTQWLIQVHNEVNKSLGKPVLTMEQVIQEYNQKIHNKLHHNTIHEYIPYCILISIIFVLLILYFMK